jgi:hypothetical protein
LTTDFQRIKTDYLRRSVASVKIRGYFCSNLASFDLDWPTAKAVFSFQLGNRSSLLKTKN